MTPRISPKEARAMYDAYAKMYAPKEEPKVDAEPKEEPCLLYTSDAADDQ